MKAAIVAVAAAMAVGASASLHHAGHNHAPFHNIVARDYAPSNATMGCGDCGEYTVWVTTYGEATLHQPPSPGATVYTTVTPTEYVVPTPFVTTYPTPGIYTVPATTITLTESTTVCGAAFTAVPAGEHTYGGVTTVVVTSTTVVCPYATLKTSGNVVTSTILTTTYVCPSAGTYTIAPFTTSCASNTVLVYPVAASYTPGIYTQSEVVTTITETDFVVFCPYTSSKAVPAPTHVAPAAAKPAYTSLAAAPASGDSSTYSSTSSGSYNIQGSAPGWAITYTPYTQSGACKAASDVAADMMAIKSKGFSTIRMYSTDCNGLSTVSAGCEAAGLKMIVGVFINESGCSGAQEQVTSIASWAKWELVELIVVGNEAIMSGFTTASELATFIASSKTAFKAAGYTGPCTTTEPLSMLLAHSAELCDVVDVVGANIHAFFNSDVLAPMAGVFVKTELAIIEALCPGKSAINLECGWPNAGTSCNGAACPGYSQQKQAIDSVMAEVGEKVVLFSYTDDTWKSPGQFGIEQHWGAFANCFN